MTSALYSQHPRYADRFNVAPFSALKQTYCICMGYTLNICTINIHTVLSTSTLCCQHPHNNSNIHTVLSASTLSTSTLYHQQPHSVSTHTVLSTSTLCCQQPQSVSTHTVLSASTSYCQHPHCAVNNHIVLSTTTLCQHPHHTVSIHTVLSTSKQVLLYTFTIHLTLLGWYYSQSQMNTSIFEWRWSH